MTQQPIQWTPCEDYSQLYFEGVAISLFELFKHELINGKPLIEGRTFVNCRIEGPGVMMALDGVTMDACNLGYTGADPLSVLFQPLSSTQAIGPAPFRNCAFRNCQFAAIGYTGAPSFIEQMKAVLLRGTVQ